MHSKTTGETGDLAATTSPGSKIILDEAAATLRELYNDTLENLVIERLVVGVFFTGVKLSNGQAGVAYTPPEIMKNAGNRILKGSTPTIRGMRAAAVTLPSIVAFRHRRAWRALRDQRPGSRS